MPPRELLDTRLVLIRTAEVERSGPARLIDHDDLGLSDDGRRQAILLGRHLASTGEFDHVARIHSAASNRARQTASVLATALGGCAVETSCGFCEPHVGRAEGRTVDEWSATDGQDRLERWSPYEPKSAGGESYATGIERAARAIVETVVAHEGRTAVIVTHTVPIRALFWLFLGLPFHAAQLDLAIDETAVTEWLVTGWMPAIGHPAARLVRHNDRSHLRD